LTENPAESLSVVLPAYNEAGNLAKAVGDAVAALDDLVDRLEIIVINDGSTDESADVLDELRRREPRVRVVIHDTNRGYGAALASGFAAAKMEWVFYTDSDNQFDFAEVGKLLELAPGSDFVIGYRLKRSEGLRRRFFAWGFKVFLRIAFGLRWRDVDCAFKLFRASSLKRIRIQSTKFFVDAELLAKARVAGLRVAEVGVRHLPRLKGATTTGLRYVPVTLVEAWRVWRGLRAGRDDS